MTATINESSPLTRPGFTQLLAGLCTKVDPINEAWEEINTINEEVNHQAQVFRHPGESSGRDFAAERVKLDLEERLAALLTEAREMCKRVSGVSLRVNTTLWIPRSRYIQNTRGTVGNGYWTEETHWEEIKRARVQAAALFVKAPELFSGGYRIWARCEYKGEKVAFPVFPADGSTTIKFLHG